MKVVVVSDIHGNRQALKKIISFNPDADYILSLGDSELPQSLLDKYKMICVKGNYPFDYGLSYDHTIQIEDTNIFMTHGHKHRVRGSVDYLFDKALEFDSHIVLYGHTHIAKVDYIEGVYIINPGSVNRSRNHIPESYLIIYIEKDNKFRYEYKEARTNRNIEL